MSTQLIRQEEIANTIQQLLISERAAAEAEEKVIGMLPVGTIRSDLEKDLVKRKAYVVALEAGFAPVDMRGFVRTDTKDEWNKKAVQAALKTMPEEVKQAWDDAKALGIFKSFSITTGGDPILVGNAGGGRFLLACWICIHGGAYTGFRFRP